MPRPRAAMRKIREALRLCLAEGLSPRQTGIAVGLPRTTVRRSVDSILEAGLDRAPLPEPTPVRVTRDHPNVRGPGY